MDNHLLLTKQRTAAYERVFGAKPKAAFPYTHFAKDEADDICIDIFVYLMHVKDEHVYALVTNGMSDRRMSDFDLSSTKKRSELIQYVSDFSESHARRLYEMAWLPHFDQFILDAGDTIEWPFPGVGDSPWQHGFFLQPILEAHRDCQMTVDGDPLSFLWYIPISTDELTFKQNNGLDMFLAVLDESELPWIFDETSRVSMV